MKTRQRKTKGMLANFPTGLLPDAVKRQDHGGKPTCRDVGQDGEDGLWLLSGALDEEPWVVLACSVASLGFSVMSKEDWMRYRLFG